MARQYGSNQKPNHAGEVRQSQLIHTFGVGSIVDFVRDTVIIGRVDKWDQDDSADKRKLYNDNLKAITGADYFLMPKTAINGTYPKSHDIESFIFPRTFYCPTCKHIINASELRNQAKKHHCFMPNENKDGKPCGGLLVASRFVLVCENGHMADFPYAWWAHSGTECAKSKNPRIQMYNVGNRSDIDSLYVKCTECGASQDMRSAFSGNIYPCQGKHPHLGPEFRSECDKKMSVRLRSSSSVYFPAIRSALAIPPWSRRAVQLIEAEYETLLTFNTFGGEPAIAEHVKKKILPKAMHSITLADLLSAFKLVNEQKTSSDIHSEADVFAAEYDVLCRGEADEDEYAASIARVPDEFSDFFESITIVDKLTVINALVGFTRINPWRGDSDKQDGEGSKLAPLSESKKPWLPAVKLLGEGIFFRFKKNALQAWGNRVGERYASMMENLNASFYINERFSTQYVALHTFAHLLIRQLADDCGYSVSSMQEKIYSTFSDKPDRPEMHGVLIYLASSDAEGSLGGLISIAENSQRLEAILMNMLQKAAWCSADPLCRDSQKQGVYSLNYAACHDCVLLPETSCEFHNLLLDRVSIVGKPESPELGLMGRGL